MVEVPCEEGEVGLHQVVSLEVVVVVLLVVFVVEEVVPVEAPGHLPLSYCQVFDMVPGAFFLQKLDN